MFPSQSRPVKFNLIQWPHKQLNLVVQLSEKYVSCCCRSWRSTPKNHHKNKATSLPARILARSFLPKRYFTYLVGFLCLFCLLCHSHASCLFRPPQISHKTNCSGTVCLHLPLGICVRACARCRCYIHLACSGNNSPVNIMILVPWYNCRIFDYDMTFTPLTKPSIFPVLLLHPV
jgi:hypothetical protein